MAATTAAANKLRESAEASSTGGETEEAWAGTDGEIGGRPR